jgi:hypothetical protein
LHDPQSILSSNRFFFVVCNHIPHQKKSNSLVVWVFYPALLAVNFGMQEPFFSIDCSPTVQIWFYPISNRLLVHRRAVSGKILTVNSVGRNRFEQNQLLSHSYFDNTVKCQSNHPPKSVHVSSGYRHKRFVESPNTPPDQLSEAQIFQNTSSGISRFFVLLGT